MTGPVVWVVLGFALLQTAWLLTLPPFRGIDEVDHVYRAAAVAGGQWVADGVPQDGRGLLVALPADVPLAAHGQCTQLKYNKHDNCAAAGTTADGKVLVASAAATYHPGFYWTIGAPALPFTGDARLYAMRIAAALLCALFVGLAAWAATRTSGPWPVVGVVVALSPVLVYSTIVAAPNGLEMAAAVALWTSLLRLRVEPDPRQARRLVWLAVACAVVLGTLRWLGPLWILLAVATVAAYDPSGLWRAVRRDARAVAAGVVLAGLSTLNLLWWMSGPAQAASNPDSVGDEQLTALYPVVWTLQTIAAFPFRDQNGPPIVYGVVGAMALTLLVLGVRSVRGRKRVVVLGACVLTVVVPLALTWVTMDSVGIIWQGRYGLPFSVGFLLLAATAVAERETPVRLPWPAGLLAGAALAWGTAASLLKVRGDELRDNAASVADAGWHVPAPALLVVLAAAGYGALVLAGHRRPVVPAVPAAATAEAASQAASASEGVAGQRADGGPAPR